MKPLLFLLLFSLSFQASAEAAPAKTAPTLRSILLHQLQTTHNQEEWFVPANIAVAGLTAEQAKWTDSKGNHSVGQLANHLVFWDTRNLEKFEGKPLAKFSGNNDETFNAFDDKQWAATVQQLDKVLTAWEKAVESAEEKKLEAWAPTIANISTHNAYHIGEIVMVRKEQGAWDASKGVK